MLVVKVHEQERVRLELPDGRFVWVTVTSAVHGSARLGFDAPQDVKILRECLVTEPRREKP